MTKTGSDNDPTTVIGSDRDAGISRSGWRGRLWTVVVVLVVLGGCAGAVVAASVQSGHDAAGTRDAFRSSSAQLASTLRLAIQHEQDLIVGAGAFVAGDPSASNAQFVRWASAVQALRRYPELVQLARLVIVSDSKLAGFAAAVVRDPVARLAGGVFSVLPAGHRSFYCFVDGSVSRERSLYPAGFDFCAGQLRSSLLTAGNVAASAYIPYQIGDRSLLVVFTPMYRGGRVPATIARREAAFLGWVGLDVLPGVLLDQALAGHPGMALRFTYHAGSVNTAFEDGKVPRDARSATIDLHNGWTVRTFAAAGSPALFADRGPAMLLVGGISVSLLLGAVVLQSATGKARAVRLVDLKTGELLHQALHDGLTGLPNRALISDRVEQLLARSRRNSTPGAVLFVDLDEFKNVNDTLGHEAGDQLLQAVAARLTGGLRSVDTIGRLGGDEFVVLIDGESQIAPALVADRLLELMRGPFELDCSPTPIMITASVGLAVGERTTAGELLRDADMALYRAKATGKNCHQVFHPEMESALRRDLEIELDLRSALTNDQFRLVYQPICNLDDLSLVGIEALLRWDHPGLGVIGPDHFIPLLESSGQILDVGRWVLNTACQQIADWHSLGSSLGVSVNVSARQLDDDAIVTDVRDALSLSALDPTKLTIEITETALMSNPQATARRLREIKLLDVNLAIDDFGTGYSSLASLQQLPIDTIKIDRAFTEALKSSPQSDAMIRILVQLGKDLGLNTLAEGVETFDQLDHLRAESVHEVQGFLLSKPLEPDAIQALILPGLAQRHPPTH